MYGMKPRCSRRECASTTPIAKPNTAPSRKPTAASFAVKSVASQSTSISSGPFRRDGSKSWPTMSWTCGSVRSFTSKLPSRKPVASPNHLKPSQRRVEDERAPAPAMAETLERGTHAYSLPR